MESALCAIKTQIQSLQMKTANLEDRFFDVLNETRTAKSTITSVEDRLDKISTELDDKIDTLESFSRRDNLKFFNIPQSSHEDYETCAKKVIDVLQDTVPGKTWASEDILRAHRLGRSDNFSRPQPVIAKFARWSDKMLILTKGRDELRKKGVRVAGDLTTRQQKTIQDYRDQGKRAFYRGNKLVVAGPLRHLTLNRGSYADATRRRLSPERYSTQNNQHKRPVSGEHRSSISGHDYHSNPRHRQLHRHHNDRTDRESRHSRYPPDNTYHQEYSTESGTRHYTDTDHGYDYDYNSLYEWGEWNSQQPYSVTQGYQWDTYPYNCVNNTESGRHSVQTTQISGSRNTNICEIQTAAEHTNSERVLQRENPPTTHKSVITDENNDAIIPHTDVPSDLHISTDVTADGESPADIPPVQNTQVTDFDIPGEENPQHEEGLVTDNSAERDSPSVFGTDTLIDGHGTIRDHHHQRESPVTESTHQIAETSESENPSPDQPSSERSDNADVTESEAPHPDAEVLVKDRQRDRPKTRNKGPAARLRSSSLLSSKDKKQPTLLDTITKHQTQNTTKKASSDHTGKQ